MLLSYVHDFLASMESDAAIRDRETALDRLRKLGLNDFSAVLWSMPLLQFPRISSLLPRMASPEVQTSWTGNSGAPLLTQSLSFIRSAACTYASLTGNPLSGKRILDFGCGYGRMTRIFYYYSDDVWAVDPWDEALNLCRDAGLTRNVFKSDDLPCALPVPEDFDLIIAFSVLTHTSDRTTRTVLKAMRKHLRPGGVAGISIRPVEYWKTWRSFSHQNASVPTGADMEERHRQAGFAFAPQNRPKVDGEITFGDTSMTAEWLTSNIPEWRIVAYDHSNDDILQRYVFLRGA